MKRLLFLLQACLGGILIVLGGFVLTSESLKMLSGLCIGLGSALAALGIGYFIQSLIVSSLENDKIKKLKDIEVNDERNTAIREKTGLTVSKTMNYLLCAFVLTLGFMGADKIFIILASSLIIAQFVLTIFFSNYYSNKI